MAMKRTCDFKGCSSEAQLIHINGITEFWSDLTTKNYEAYGLDLCKDCQCELLHTIISSLTRNGDLTVALPIKVIHEYLELCGVQTKQDFEEETGGFRI